MNLLDPNRSKCCIHLCRRVNFRPFFCSGRSLIHYSRGLSFSTPPSALVVFATQDPLISSKVLSSSVLNGFPSAKIWICFIRRKSHRSSKYLMQRGNTWKIMVRFWWTSQLKDVSWWLIHHCKIQVAMYSLLLLNTLLPNLNMLSKVLHTQLLHMLYSRGPCASCQAVQPPRMIVLGWIRLSAQQAKMVYSI